MRHVHGGDLSDLAALVGIWTHGWAKTRGLPPPVADNGALRIEVGQPDQRRRFVFVDPPGTIASHAARIAEPFVLLKAPVRPDVVRAVLPTGWQVERTGTFMTIAALSDPRPHPVVKLTPEGTALRATIALEGALAASGRVVVLEGYAVFDQIVTQPEFYRRGFGTAIMAALTRAALDLGATRGLLTATDMGRGLYERLGWRALAPWTTANLR